MRGRGLGETGSGARLLLGAEAWMLVSLCSAPTRFPTLAFSPHPFSQTTPALIFPETLLLRGRLQFRGGRSYRNS